MKDKYILEIHYPVGDKNEVVYFASDVPFQSINKGDFISGTTLPDADHANPYIVASVEHTFTTDEARQTQHKIAVHTQVSFEPSDGSWRVGRIGY